MFPDRRGGHVLFPDGKTLKIWQYKCLWFNQDRFGHGRYRVNNFYGVTPKLYPHNQPIVDLLKTIQVVPKKYSKVFLTGAGMSPSRRCQGKMPMFYVVIDGG